MKKSETKGEDARGENEGEEEEEEIWNDARILFHNFRGTINSNLDSHHEIPWEISSLTPLSNWGHFPTRETYSAICFMNQN